MIEIISVANAEDPDRRRDTLYGVKSYKSPIVQREINLRDLDNKSSPFYIRQKIEIGVVAQRISNPYFKNFIMIVLCAYMYGAICLKYVS